MEQKSVNGSIIIGASEVGVVISEDMDKNVVHKTNSFYWNTRGNDFLRAIVGLTPYTDVLLRITAGLFLTRVISMKAGIR